MIRRLALLSACCLAMPASAQDFAELLDASIGYTHVRDNVVMIETETGGAFCKLDVADADFAAVRNGLPAIGPSATCLPYSVLNGRIDSSDDRSFTDMIDQSEGYVGLRQGVVLVEEGTRSAICQITISDADFARFESQGESGVTDARAVCIPVSELEN